MIKTCSHFTGLCLLIIVISCLNEMIRLNLCLAFFHDFWLHTMRKLVTTQMLLTEQSSDCIPSLSYIMVMALLNKLYFV